MGGYDMTEEYDRIMKGFMKRMNAIDYPVIATIIIDRKTGKQHLYYDESTEGKALVLYCMGQIADRINFSDEEKERLEKGIPPTI